MKKCKWLAPNSLRNVPIPVVHRWMANNWALAVSTLVLCGMRWKCTEEIKELEEFLCQLPRQSREGTVGAGDDSFCLRKLGMVTVPPRATAEGSMLKLGLKNTEITMKICLQVLSAMQGEWFLGSTSRTLSTVFLFSCRGPWIPILAFCLFEILSSGLLSPGARQWGAGALLWALLVQIDILRGMLSLLCCHFMPAESCHIHVVTLWLYCKDAVSGRECSANAASSAAVPMQHN